MSKFSLCPCSGKNFEKFLRPAVLAILAKGESYGYSIAEEILALYKYEKLDKGGLYKTLRAMEDEGYVSSRWDASDNSPSRRIYKIEKLGFSCLDTWQNSLKNYKSQIEKLLKEIEKIKK